jgi:hypothetical protein
MSDAKIEPPMQPDRWAKLIEVAARRAVLVGIVVGGLIGLALGGIVLNIVGCQRKAAFERENQRILDEWQAEQNRKQEEERRWRTP